MSKSKTNAQPRIFQAGGNLLDALVTCTGIVKKQTDNVDQVLDILANAGMQSAQYVDEKARQALADAQSA